MWLTNSSIGRKLIMSITGACLILFLTFHVLMNAVAIVWPTAYNTICQLLGANWYALVASMGLAALFVLHIVYAFILTLQNRKARGNDRYNVTTLPPHVEWSSNNMLVLGIVVVAFLVVHMIQFWAKMQLVEALSHDPATWAVVDGAAANPAMGTLFIHAAFSQVWTPIVYIIGFVALWFHMNHGFWSMFQTAGWNNDTWLPRLKKVACWWTTIVVGLFTIQAVWFTYQAKSGEYLNNPELQEQYLETYVESFKHSQEIQLSKYSDILNSQESEDAKLKKINALEQEISKEMNNFQNTLNKLCPTALKKEEAQQIFQQRMFMMQQMQQGQAPMGGGEEIIPADSTAVTPQGQPTEGAADQKATADDKKAEATANENKTNSQK
ncbi:MAG: hypothetical protein IKJ52_07475 [Muribaculaceae bacterium]|nr:hypothetical protein [Muribaculaceae bacterium]